MHRYYVLTATKDGHTNAHAIKAENTLIATMEAIEYILDHAYEDKTGSWATGHIKLIDPYGNIMQEMEAK